MQFNYLIFSVFIHEKTRAKTNQTKNAKLIIFLVYFYELQNT